MITTSRTKGLALIGGVLLLTACTDKTTAPTMRVAAGGPSAVRIAGELDELRARFARYNDFANAVADGYVLGYHGAAAGCVASAAGGMGYHYFNDAAMDDPAIDSMKPEVLVYHEDEDGRLKLGAVEWVVPKSTWEAAGNTAPPMVYAHALHIINPALNWYVEHAWLYSENPAGVWVDFSPDVMCP
jgi:hypothetical protein